MPEFLIASAVIAGHVVFWLAVAICLIAVPVGLPGTWGMIALALVFGLCTSFQAITLWGLAGMAVAALVGEGIEFLGGLAGAKYGGASNRGMLAAMAGGLAGAALGTILIPIPLAGSVLGAFAGCFAATVAVEYQLARRLDGAVKAGVGAFLGKLLSTVAKTGIAAGMAVWLAWRLYFAALAG